MPVENWAPYNEINSKASHYSYTHYQSFIFCACECKARKSSFTLVKLTSFSTVCEPGKV